ncbi:MAG: alpha/beta fold hydrolase [Myxococcota bacterium]
MRWVGFALAALLGVALIAYAVGLGIYAVASTRPGASTQPRTPDEAELVLERLRLADAYPFGHRFLLTPHGRMHFADEGSGSVVLCLHSSGGWSLECAELLRARPMGTRIVAPDLIGFGLSEKPAGQAPDAIAAHAADLGVLVEILDLHDVQVVAAPSSTPIAAELARLEPGRVRATVTHDDSLRGERLADRLARAPLLGEILVQGLGALSPGLAHGPLGRVQGSWDERASSLALARAGTP